jgi:hypothetical protein
MVILVALSAGCANRDDRLIDEATQEFHRRWAARQLHEIFVASSIPETKAPEARWVFGWSLSWREQGVFRADTGTSYIYQDATLDGTRHMTLWRGALYTRGPVVEQFFWAIKGNTIRLNGFMLVSNSELQCQSGLLGRSCQTVRLGPPTPETPPGQTIWSLRKGYETTTCEVAPLFLGTADWQTVLYRNGELTIRHRFGTEAEALTHAKELRGQFEQPGWVPVGDDHH